MLPGGVIRGRKNPLHFALPERLKRARKAARWTRHHLSLEAGLAWNAASEIEEGRRVPLLDTVEKLARALKISACSLAYGMEGPPPHMEVLRSESVGERLARIGTGQGVSRKGLARQIEMSPTSITNIEEGRSMPSLATVELLAKALEVPPCWLAYGEGDPGT